MKRLLVLAHRPPPYHGQSFIVGQILDGLQSAAKSQGIEVEVIEAGVRYSEDIGDIGVFKARKLRSLLSACWTVFNLRKCKTDIAYYVPSPGKRIAFWRDLVIVSWVRILGIPRIYHWQAGGLSVWLSQEALFVERFLGKFIHKGALISVIPVEEGRENAAYFSPCKIVKINNGIPDPCFDSIGEILDARKNRFLLRKLLLNQRDSSIVTFNVLFMAHCTRDKGLFDAIDAVMLANNFLEQKGVRIRFSISIYGKFMLDSDKQEFFRISKSPCWIIVDPVSGGTISLLSYEEFVSGDEKYAAFTSADVLCFPSYYLAEAIPTVILDALSFGLPVVATKWRGIPELLPCEGIPLCEIRNPQKIADALLESLWFDNFYIYRKKFLECFSSDIFLSSLAKEIL